MDIVFKKKAKCSLCGKIGLACHTQSLLRHLRLAHNIKKGRTRDYFFPADDDALLDIAPGIKKEYFKNLNKETNIDRKKMQNKELVRKYGKLQHKSVHWGRVLTSAFETKRR